MLSMVKMRFAQIADSVRSNGWRSIPKETVFLKRTAVVVEKDLSEVRERLDSLTSARLNVLEIDEAMVSSGTYHFAVEYRHLKALNYIRQGYGGYALARDHIIVGDMWYYASEVADDPGVLHVDLRRFGFKTWGKEDVYTFDIFVAPTERRQGVSAAFQNSAMLALRFKGFTKAFGFYWADNIQAHWCTRVTNRWKVLRKVCVSRFLIFTRTSSARRKRRAANATGRTGK